MSDLAWFRPLHHLNLNRLLAFMAVVEMQSFRAAAEQVRISQSALSVQVRQLEEDLGVPLLHRTTRAVTLTDEGRRFYAVIKRLSTDIVQVTAELKGEAALQQGKVTIAVLPSLAATLLPQVMSEFSTLYPGIELRLRDADSHRALDLVRHGDVDIGLLSRNDRQRDMSFIPLLQDEFLALAPGTGHPLSGRSQVRLGELVDYPLFLNPQGVDLRDSLDILFHHESATPRPSQELIGTHALVSLVSSGFGVTVLPRMALHGLDLSRCRLLRVTPSAGREIGILSARNRSESPAIAALRKFLEANATRIGKAMIPLQDVGMLRDNE